MLLSWLNFALFGVQVFVNSQHARQIGPASRRHNTPLTPAPYAFRIWGLIYSLLVPTLILDCMYPKYSFFDLSNDPNSLRVAFSLSCVANISWILLFPRNFVHTSSIIIMILWLSLLPLYISITDSWQQNQFSWIRFLGSELSIMIYCAWACIAASISVSISVQVIQKNSLPVEVYIGIISFLIGLCAYATIVRREMISSLVAVWALVAIVARKTENDNKTAVNVFGIRCCAIQAIMTILGMAVIAQHAYCNKE